MSDHLRIKICCIGSVEEAAIAASQGADFLGLVGPMPSGPGVLDLDRAAQIAAAVPGSARPVLLSSGRSAAEIAEEVSRTGVGAVQIVRHVAPSVHGDLARLLPEVTRIQVIHVDPVDSPAGDFGPADPLLEMMADYGMGPDFFLLDSGRPSASELGGTGRRHDWTVSAGLVKAAARPVFLAGGLTPENVAEAVDLVRPYGVDVCTGVRRANNLDGEFLAAFVRTARAAAAGRASRQGGW